VKRGRLVWFLHTANPGGIHALVERFCGLNLHSLRVVEVCPSGSPGVERMTRGRRVRVIYHGFRLSSSLWKTIAGAIRILSDLQMLLRLRLRDRRRRVPSFYVVTGFFLPHIVLGLRATAARTTVTLNSDLIEKWFGRISVLIYRALGCRVVCEGRGVAGKYWVPTGKDNELLFYPIVSEKAFQKDLHCRAEARAVLGIDDSTIVFGGLGNFVRQKGWDRFVAMLEHWTPIPGTKVLIVGRYQEQQRKWFENNVLLRLKDMRIPLQVVECDRPAVFYLNAFDVFILPSVAEGIATVTLEAIRCGLPVLANNVGSLSDVVQHGVNGYLLSPFDSASWKERMTELATCAHTRERMGAESLTISQREFSEPFLQARLMRAIAGEWDACINEVLP